MAPMSRERACLIGTLAESLLYGQPFLLYCIPVLMGQYRDQPCFGLFLSIRSNQEERERSNPEDRCRSNYVAASAVHYICCFGRAGT